jgi:hypothetical protein
MQLPPPHHIHPCGLYALILKQNPNYFNQEKSAQVSRGDAGGPSVMAQKTFVPPVQTMEQSAQVYYIDDGGSLRTSAMAQTPRVSIEIQKKALAYPQAMTKRQSRRPSIEDLPLIAPESPLDQPPPLIRAKVPNIK